MKVQFSNKPTKKGGLVFFVSPKGRLIVSSKQRKANSKALRFTSKLILNEKIDPTKESITQVYSPEAQELFVVCLGEKKTVSFRNLGANLGKKLQANAPKEIQLLLPEREQGQVIKNLELFIEGVLLGNYNYDEFKKAPKKPVKKTQDFLIWLTPNWAVPNGEIDTMVKKAEIMAGATNLARDLGNKPGNYFTPTDFKKACEKVAKETGLEFSALDEKQMKAEKMGCILAVSQGSDEPAWMNFLEYKCKKKNAPTLMLVGKGLTFDSGGISLKPGAGMDEMKFDMLGGAGVLGAMQAIALLKPNVNVVGIIPTSENMPNGKAAKPGDVITACDGTTVEVLNTDAEGRLILADALAYGVKTYKPDAIVDMATLTGACLMALGSYHAGLISNNPKLTSQVQAASDLTGDPVWELPAHEIYEKQIKGDISDLKNIGGREAGTITAGLFLKHFVGDTPWVHLDIAGTGWNADRIPFYPKKGATGTGVRLLAELALNYK
ncbi:MAG: leucyl aminopeptidase [SAR324 cluster bacterium]|nr:leucyl aminopeptidase [SAR324 cluster bacterium]